MNNKQSLLSLLFLAAPLWAMEYTDLPPDMGSVLHYDDPVLAASFSPDSKFIATYTGDQKVTVRDVSTGEIIKEYPDEKNSFIFKAFGHSLSFSDNGILVAFVPATASKNNTQIIVYNLDKKEEVAIFENDDTAAYYISLSSDGSLIASVSPSNQQRIVRKIPTGEIVAKFSYNYLYRYDLLSFNGKLIAFIDDKHTIIQRIADGQVIAKLPYLPKTYDPNAIALSQDGSLIAINSGSFYVENTQNNIISVYNISDGQIIAEYTKPINPYSYRYNVLFSPNMELVALEIDEKMTIRTLKSILKKSQKAPDSQAVDSKPLMQASSNNNN